MKNLFSAAGAAFVLAVGLVPMTASAQQTDAASAPAATPAATPAPATASAAAATPTAGGTLIAVAKADPELSTFAKLAEGAGLGTTLSGAGPLTLLAPSNAAFAKLPADQLAELSKPENVAKLQQVLLYHVIPAAAPTSALKGSAGEVPSAVASAKLTVDGTGDAVKVNGATVTKADVTASNGTIHVVDTVLIPPAAGATASGNGGQ